MTKHYNCLVDFPPPWCSKTDTDVVLLCLNRYKEHKKGSKSMGGKSNYYFKASS